MARPLMTIVPLLLSAASATPPVPADRVTGNVSTEHHQRRVAPPTDACRVTGNLVPSKSTSTQCRLRIADRGPLDANAWLDASCVGVGRYGVHEDALVCVLPPRAPGETASLNVPAAQATPVPVESTEGA